MATQRLTMKNIREILRQKWALQRSHRDVAASLDVSAGVVGKVVGKASEAGLTWDAVQALSDEALERVVYDGEPVSRARPLPDFTHIHAQRRRKGVTLALLHVEYLEKNRDGYRYTQFCELYRTWLKQRGWTMRIDHVAGDKAFVDYSGNRPSAAATAPSTAAPRGSSTSSRSPAPTGPMRDCSPSSPASTS